MNESISRNDIVKFLLANESFLSQDAATQISEKLLTCSNILKPNITEWLKSKPFSDIWVRDKYCLNAVLKIRDNNGLIVENGYDNERYEAAHRKSNRSIGI